jgi:hypothetical protein
MIFFFFNKPFLIYFPNLWFHTNSEEAVEHPAEGAQHALADQKEPRIVATEEGVGRFAVDKVPFFQAAIDASGCGDFEITAHRAACDRGRRLAAVHIVLLVAQVGVKQFQGLVWVEGAVR